MIINQRKFPAKLEKFTGNIPQFFPTHTPANTFVIPT